MADLSDQPAFETGGLATCPTAPEAGNQGLEPCKIGFGDQFAPCALPMKWTWRDLNTLPPACKTGALPGELRPHNYLLTFAILEYKIKPVNLIIAEVVEWHTRQSQKLVRATL